jgi:hypothetical protein
MSGRAFYPPRFARRELLPAASRSALRRGKFTVAAATGTAGSPPPKGKGRGPCSPPYREGLSPGAASAWSPTEQPNGVLALRHAGLGLASTIGRGTVAPAARDATRRGM